MASAIKEKVANAVTSSSSAETANLDSEGHDRTKNYRLRITAGPTYDKSLQRVLQVNSDSPHAVSDHCAVSVRIRDYSGLPSTSPSSVPSYFDLPQHSKDTFSVAWVFTPPRDIPASDLYFGIDTGHNPLRKFGLPKSLVNTAFKIVKEFIDPSLSCDAGVDEPWVRGPAVAGATTTLCVGDLEEPSPPGGATQSGNAQQPATPEIPSQDSSAQPGQQASLSPAAPSSRRASSSSQTTSPPRKSSSSSTTSTPPADLSHLHFPDPALLVEGAVSPSAAQHRKDANIPSDPAKRRKHFLSEPHRKDYVLQKGRTYYFDFSNGYIDWAAYALKLPGFSVPVLKWIGGGKSPDAAAGGSAPPSRDGEGKVEGGSGDTVGEGASGAETGHGKDVGSTADGGSGGHKVRFFLKDLKTGEVFFVIMCTLLTGQGLREALEEDKAATQH